MIFPLKMLEIENLFIDKTVNTPLYRKYGDWNVLFELLSYVV